MVGVKGTFHFCKDFFYLYLDAHVCQCVVCSLFFSPAKVACHSPVEGAVVTVMKVLSSIGQDIEEIDAVK
eukprot:6170426-Ditylum_brightwellii.AAC.1